MDSHGEASSQPPPPTSVALRELPTLLNGDDALPAITSLHDIHLRYKLAPPTFKTLCTVQKGPDRRQVLQIACLATEFRLFPIKLAERGLLRDINDHTAIPYPIKEAIAQPWHKVFLLVQIDLLRTGWPNKISANGRKELYHERGRMYKLLDRVLRCLADLLGQRQDGRGVSVALDVLRSVKAGIWEGSERELLQVDGIGAVKVDKLIQAGVKTIKQLSKLQFYHIERLLSRNPPFGHQMVRHLAGFPILTLHVGVIGKHAASHIPVLSGTEADGSSVTGEASLSPRLLHMVRVVLGYENEELPAWSKRSPWATLVIEGADGRLLWFWRGSVKRMVDDKEMVVGLDANEPEQLKVTFACEEIIGTIIRTTCQV